MNESASNDLRDHHEAWVRGEDHPGEWLDDLLEELRAEVERQDAKHGPFIGSPLGRSRLAIACLEDEVAETREAWRSERKAPHWNDTRTEALQVAAVALRAIRDALSGRVLDGGDQ